MERQDISRNDAAARQELTRQARALALMRPLAELLNARLKGRSEQLDECDAVAAAMWLFDHMLYHETRASCPGTTRKEAETLLLTHFQQSDLGWDDGTCIDIARNIFRLLTPRDGFRHNYYDFTESCHKAHFFRLIDWEHKEGEGVLYRLTQHGLVLYSTRLEDDGIESATVSALRANRTLRRGEIQLAIELAHGTATSLRRFRLRIRASLRDARTGDISFTFVERMKPLLDDAYDLMEEILEQTASTQARIRQDAPDASPEKRKVLLQAEESFQSMVLETRTFRSEIKSIQKDYADYRRELIGLPDQSPIRHDLTAAVLTSLLDTPVSQLAAHTDQLLAQLLPPQLEPLANRKDRYCIDPGTLLATYLRWLERQNARAPAALDEDADDYTEPPPLLGRDTIERAARWVDTRLASHGAVTMQDVIDAARQQPMKDNLMLACMLSIGAEATSDKADLEAQIHGRICHKNWAGDNLGIRRPEPR